MRTKNRTKAEVGVGKQLERAASRASLTRPTGQQVWGAATITVDDGYHELQPERQGRPSENISKRAYAPMGMLQLDMDRGMAVVDGEPLQSGERRLLAKGAHEVVPEDGAVAVIVRTNVPGRPSTRLVERAAVVSASAGTVKVHDIEGNYICRGNASDPAIAILSGCFERDGLACLPGAVIEVEGGALIRRSPDASFVVVDRPCLDMQASCFYRRGWRPMYIVMPLDGDPQAPMVEEGDAILATLEPPRPHRTASGSRRFSEADFRASLKKAVERLGGRRIPLALLVDTLVDNWVARGAIGTDEADVPMSVESAAAQRQMLGLVLSLVVSLGESDLDYDALEAVAEALGVTDRQVLEWTEAFVREIETSGAEESSARLLKFLEAAATRYSG